MTFAVRTKVPVAVTRGEIERVLTKYGAQRFAVAIEPQRATLIFEISDRRVRFRIPLPEEEGQEMRSRWRAILLAIKAKLESVESGIETFEEAFLAHVVMPDGKTVHEHAQPGIAIAYKGGKMPPLLSGPA